MGQRRYEPVETQEKGKYSGEAEIAVRKEATAQTGAKICTLIGFVVLLGLVFTTIWLLVHSLTISGLDVTSCACGSSANEAIANGCKFDPYELAWLPDHCRDDDLMESFAQLGVEQHHNWTFFTFPDAAKQLSLGEVGAMAGDPYETPGRIRTTVDWHNSHCVYVLMHSFRISASTRLGMAQRYRTEKHTKHCVEALLRLVAAHPHSGDAFGDSEVDVYIER